MFGFLGSPCVSCTHQSTSSAYRSFFCGLSSALRDDYGLAARLLVNRDATFLSITTAFGQNVPANCRSCCNPLGQARSLYDSGLHAQFAAAVTVCGLATKLEDDRADERGLRRLFAANLSQLTSSWKDRAIATLNTLRFPVTDVQDLMRSQATVESHQPDLKAAAQPTALAYGIIFAEAARHADQPQEAYRGLGENLGRLTYYRDAWDDFPGDQKAGRFNPLTSRSSVTEAFSATMVRFQELTKRCFYPSQLISSILTSTEARHAPLTGQNPKKKEKNSRKRDQCWEDCCSSCDCGCCDCH